MPEAQLMLCLWIIGQERIDFSPVLVRQCCNGPNLPFSPNMTNELLDASLFCTRSCIISADENIAKGKS